MRTIMAAFAALVLLTPASGAPGDSAAPRFDSTAFMSRLNRELAVFDQAKSTDAAGKQAVSPARAEKISVPGLIVKICVYLGIVIVVIFGLAWLTRKGGMAGSSKIGGGNMDTLEVLPFGQNRSLVLARVVDAVYVLAQTPSGMTVLEKIEGQRALDIIASSRGVVSITKFKDAFSHFMGKMKKS